jgi:hypothetical protein
MRDVSVAAKVLSGIVYLRPSVPNGSNGYGGETDIPIIRIATGYVLGPSFANVGLEIGVTHYRNLVDPGSRAKYVVTQSSFADVAFPQSPYNRFFIGHGLGDIAHHRMGLVTLWDGFG